jgi:hypothetical protein
VDWIALLATGACIYRDEISVSADIITTAFDDHERELK